MDEHTDYVNLTFVFEKEGNQWVGTCLELGTSTFERTLAETRTALKALVKDHVAVLAEAGEIDRFYEEWGIKVHSTSKRGSKVYGEVMPVG